MRSGPLLSCGLRGFSSIKHVHLNPNIHVFVVKEFLLALLSCVTLSHGLRKKQ